MTKFSRLLSFVMSLNSAWPRWIVFGIICLNTQAAFAVNVTSNPTTCSSVSGIGTRTWNNPSRATTSINNYATASVDGTTSLYLKCKGYGFTIPSGATINGITVNVERKSNRTTDGGSRDAAMRIVNASDVIGTTDNSTATLYTTSDVTEAHGGATNLWGQAWTAADINNANFGAAFAAIKASSAGRSHTISVDAISITVTYTLDTTPPTVSSIVRNSPNPSAANTVSWTVTFSENVTGVNAADFTLTPVGLTGTSISSVTGSGATYTVTANTGAGNGSLQLNLVDDDSIIDVAGNKLGSTGLGNGSFSGASSIYTIDKSSPLVNSINRSGASPTNATSVSWTVIFSESVTGVDGTDFSLIAGGITSATISSVTGSGTTYTVTANSYSGAGTLGLNLVDDDSIIDSLNNKLGGTGATNGNATGQVYTIDRIAPSVLSISRANLSPISANQVTWTVTFSESVTNVDTADFSLIASGLAGVSIILVIGSGTTWDVLATTGIGAGTLGLNLVDDDTIIDTLTNPLGGTGALNGNFTGDIYTISDTPPLAGYHMDESLWNGTTGEVTDETGNYPGTAKNSAVTADVALRAITGDPGTCRYGAFTIASKSHVELDVDFPDMTDSFTITAWIKTSDNTKVQWIFADNTSGNGYAISLGDPGSGKLRFFTKNYTPLDLTSTVLTNNTWYFIAAVADFGVSNVTRKLYVYSAAGSLLSTISDTTTIIPIASWPTDAGAASIGGNTGASSSNFGGNIDEVRIYDGTLSQTAIAALAVTKHACLSCALGSFRITQQSTALACPDTRAQVTVEPMCSGGGTVKNDYAGTVSLTTSPAPASTSYYNAASGGSLITNVAFSSGDLIKTAYLYYPNEASVCAVANDGSISTSSTSCTSFHAYGFKVSTAPVDFACGSSSSLTLTAYGKTLSGAGQSCEVMSGFSGAKNIKAWFTSSINPDTAAVRATNANLTVGGTNISNKVEPASANISGITFASGIATVSLSATNAAEILGLNFKYDATPYNGVAGAITSPFGPLTASSTAFVVYPKSFELSVTDAGSSCIAGDASCTVFKKAGESFNMKLKALCNDGTTIASDYVNGGSAIPLTINSLVAPVAGAIGALSTTSTNITTGGFIDYTQTWSEVGVATFKALPPSWFGRTFTPAITGNIGRFKPDHFDEVITQGCSAGGYTYSAQPFSVQITALNQSNDKTVNYDGTAITTPNFSKAVTLSELNAIAGSISPTAVAASAFTAGVASASPAFTFTTAPTTPSTIKLRAVDTDSVSTATGATESAATALIRSGRLHLLNAYGSELLAIKVPVQAEYYNGTNWIINTSDTCTTITAGSVTASNGIATNTCFLTNPRPSAPTNASCQASSPAMTTAAGVGSWYVFDKTTPQVGYTDLTINLSATPWLLGRWSGSGTSYTENPIARIKFGSPKAPYIYLRERY